MCEGHYGWVCVEPGVHHRLHRVEHAGHGRPAHPSHHCTQHQVVKMVHIIDGKLELEQTLLFDLFKPFY